MLINVVTFTAHYWPHAEWPRPLLKNSYMAGGKDSVSVGADLRVRPE